MLRVIAQPQRGHCDAAPAQVVPQDEQVLVPDEQVRPRPLTQERLHEQFPPDTAVVLAESSQADLGNKGREKNSSHPI